MTKYYKFLKSNGEAPFADNHFPDTSGNWSEPITELELCRNGYHVAELHQLRNWFRIGDLYKVEVRGLSLTTDDKSCHESIRYERKIGTVTANIAVQLAIWSAEKVLHIFEEQFPNDNRPRLAIEAAKRGDKGAADAAYAAYADAAAYAYAARAADAAYAYAAAAYAAAAYAADAAAAAADAADAAYAAAARAADAAAAAADAAAARAADAAAARKEFQIEWSKKLIELLETS